MKKFAIVLSAVSAAAMPSIAFAKSPGELAGAFGARPAVSHISISPDGNKLAYIGPSGEEDDVLFIVDLEKGTEPNPILEVSEDSTELNWCVWANDERLVCRIRIVKDDSGIVLGYSRLFALKYDGSDSMRLTKTPSNPMARQVQYGGKILKLDIEGKPDFVMMARLRGGLAVEEVSLKDTKQTWIEDGNPNAVDYMVDENGRLRLMATRAGNATGQTQDRVAYYYRTQDSDDWKLLSETEDKLQTASGFRPVSVLSSENVAYGFDKIDGYDALFKLKLDGSGEREKVLARNDVDVDGLIRIGRNDRVVGVSYATDKSYVEYFDPELEKLAKALAGALPGNPLITWLDADSAENKLLFAASSDTDPGMVYLFDKSTRQLSEVIPIRDYLGSVKMGSMKPITYAAGDGTEIPGYLTLPPGSDGKNLPTIVMPHGGPGSRDVWGFDWLVQFFTSRGYAVVQPNFRGSSGYGDAWFGRNGFQAWQTAVGDVNDAGRWAIREGIADPTKIAVMGWSYGGYAALQSQVLDPDLFKAVVAVAPVTDLDLLKEENRQYTSWAQVREFVGSGPHVEAGSPARHAEKFKAPVILFHGTLDQNVADAHSRKMERRLKSADKPVTYIEFKDLQHDLDNHAARSRMLAETDAFLTKALGD